MSWLDQVINVHRGAGVFCAEEAVYTPFRNVNWLAATIL